MNKKVFAILPLLFPSLAAAQVSPATPAGPAVTATAPALEMPAPPVATEPPAAAASALAERLAAAEAKLKQLEDAQSATKTSLDVFKKLKISGYVQGRFERRQDSADGANLANNALALNPSDRFYVRHGYVRTAYQGQNMEYMLQVDSTGDGVAFKDAEATFVDTWTPLHFRVTVGQFKLPFGHELPQSDADRELPEHPLIIGGKGYFDGDRDRGVRVQAQYGWAKLAMAVVNGNGVKDKVYGTADPTAFKDLVGRLGVDFTTITGGVSAYYGRGTLDTTLVPAKDTTPASISYTAANRLRLGADVEAYLKTPSVGALVLKGEVIWGKDTARDFQSSVADPCKTGSKMGWLVSAVQNFGTRLGVAVRLDQVDPSLSGAIPDACASATLRTKSGADRITTLGGALLVYVSPNLKLTAAYEHPWEQGAAVDNDVLTTQIQARF